MAAGNTYEAIATQTLGSAASSVTFNSISGAYTDLILVANLKKASGLISNLALTINSDTGSNYSYTRLIGDGSTASSDRTSSTGNGIGGYCSTNWGTNIIAFNNYSNTSTYKTFMVRTNNDRVAAVVNLWRSTAAISSIKLEEVVTGDIATGSTFTLYGIKAA